ncbi:hypothetical protein Clacol_004915 [Clathrus columnatus]|uniref:Uncharacterized protein n=1 Tax=Clathrus columnatus TaxID=1419009 RepID=A0AAV5AC11_9AGAM|nr:hypothetical protein Clacol_004915 [Clathrus columnatus]
MPTPLFTKPSLPVATNRQLPQHPKMRLSYILNPSTPTRQNIIVQPIVSASVPIPEEAASASPSFQDAEEHGLPLGSPSSSRSRSPSLSEWQNIIPTPIPDIAALSPHPLPDTSATLNQGSASPEIHSITPVAPELLSSSVSSNSHQELRDHDLGDAFATRSVMNQPWDELSLRVCRQISPIPLRCTVVPTSVLNIPPISPVFNPQSHSINVTPSSETLIRQPIPQHPKMRLSYILNPSSPTTPRPELAEPPHAESRSPSSTISEYGLSSLIDSPVDNRSTVLTTLHTLHDESPLASPVTTPSSSPPPIAPTVPDLPTTLVEPPQVLPWEGTPPPGLNPQNHRVYQRGGVHWMFGPDIG